MHVEWIKRGSLRKLVLAIINGATGETVERWQFDIEVSFPKGGEASREEETINKEIRAIIRQITASICFLPLLDGEHALFVALKLSLLVLNLLQLLLERIYASRLLNGPLLLTRACALRKAG